MGYFGAYPLFEQWLLERWLLLCVVGITAKADELGTVELYLGFTRQYYAAFNR